MLACVFASFVPSHFNCKWFLCYLSNPPIFCFHSSDVRLKNSWCLQNLFSNSKNSSVVLRVGKNFTRLKWPTRWVSISKFKTIQPLLIRPCSLFFLLSDLSCLSFPHRLAFLTGAWWPGGLNYWSPLTITYPAHQKIEVRWGQSWQSNTLLSVGLLFESCSGL